MSTRYIIQTFPELPDDRFGSVPAHARGRSKRRDEEPARRGAAAVGADSGRATGGMADASVDVVSLAFVSSSARRARRGLPL